MSRATLRFLSPREDSQAGKSIRKAACSGGGVLVLSLRASRASFFPSPLSHRGSDCVTKEWRACASGERQSLALSWPQSLRPERTWRAAKVASAPASSLGSLPLSLSLRDHFQHTARTS